MTLGDAMHRLARGTPRPIVAWLQRLANRSPRGRAILARWSAPMRHGARTIASGPAQGLLIDVAGSRPSYVLGTAEPDAVQFFVDHVKPGDTVLDLGANVGYFTLIAAVLTGPTGKVVSYEPIPANAAALRRNVELNHLTNVEVVEAAMSDSPGTAEISVGNSDQTASLVAPRPVGTLTVRTVNLDLEVDRVGAPAVIKCDIEGAEYAAFATAERALAGHPALLCEVHRMYEGDEARFEAILHGHGYQLRWLERGDWTSHLVATAS
jgi:FkbM family methyltransferase